jgi:hypothetical protein
MPVRAASRITASPGSVSLAASRKSLRTAKWMCGSTFPSAWTSRWERNSVTCSTRSRIVGTITIVRAEAGTRSYSSRGSRFGGTSRATARWSSWIASSLSGTSASSATTTRAAPRQPCACA